MATPRSSSSNIDGRVILDEIVDWNPIVGEYFGHVKWFNDRLGYGFCTICNGPDKGRDIFVHHSGIRPLNSNYKSLRKGEYINFNLTNGHNGMQAVDVTGVHGGPLMCDVIPFRRPILSMAAPRIEINVAPPPPPPPPPPPLSIRRV